jgi:anthranilate phosphoribosyltransferase
LEGRKLSGPEIAEIIRDLIRGDLSEIEVTAFVTSLNNFRLDLDEATSLSTAMVQSGKTLNLTKRPIVDKHSIAVAIKLRMRVKCNSSLGTLASFNWRFSRSPDQVL